MDDRFCQIREASMQVQELWMNLVAELEKKVDDLTRRVVELEEQLAAQQERLQTETVCRVPVVEPEDDLPSASALEETSDLPAVESVMEPVAESVVESVMEPVAESVVESVVESVMEPLVDPVMEKEPEAEPEQKPATEAEPKPVAEVEPVSAAVEVGGEDGEENDMPEFEPELPFGANVLLDGDLFAGVVELSTEVEPISEQEQQLSILEAAARRAQPAWLVDLAGPEVTDVRKALSLNDRIVLIRELFHNSGDALAAALDAANQANSLAEFVDKMRCDHPDWDEQDPLVYRYYMIVRRKIRN